jgi:hypothetical protein
VAEEYDQEVNAIRAVLKALEGLTPDARASVIEYVTKRLGVSVEALAPMSMGSGTSRVITPATGRIEIGGELPQLISTPIHIKAFKEQKNPKSASEMAAIVAYYLSELAPADKRRKRINAADIETYFKIADFPLPDVRYTLPNAKNAGYFNAVGDGEYELNAVGHNLVAHNLPRTKNSARSSARKRVKKGRSTKRS